MFTNVTILKTIKWSLVQIVQMRKVQPNQNRFCFAKLWCIWLRVTLLLYRVMEEDYDHYLRGQELQLKEERYSPKVKIFKIDHVT